MIENKNAEKRADNRLAPDAEFGYVDPHSLVLSANVRTDAEASVDADPEFVESIRDRGVLETITVKRVKDGSGRLQVERGHRRTVGAIKAEQALVPIRVVPDDGDEADRLADQLMENVLRVDLRVKDQVGAYKQLSLLGLSDAQIAKRTHTKKAMVTTALGVAGSKVATDAQADYDLDLYQAATVGEFDGDPEAVKKLTDIAANDPGQFAHTAQRLRDARDRAARKAEAQRALSEAGVREVPPPGYYDTKIQPLGDLTDRAGNALTEEIHRACPGHAAYLEQDGQGYTTVVVCTDYQANKHRRPRVNTTTPVDPETAARAKAERAEVRTNNKAWTSAETVRRQWLAEFAKRRTAPKDAPNFLAGSLTADTHSIDKASLSAHGLACEWLGLKTTGGWGSRQALFDQIARATPARALHISLVLTLAAIEDRTGVQTWRDPGSEARYFRALEAWGYTLADVEQIARGPQETPAASTKKKANAPKQEEAVKRTEVAKPSPAAAVAQAPEQTKPKADNTPKVTTPNTTRDKRQDAAKDDDSNRASTKGKPAPNPRKGSGKIAGGATGAKQEATKPEPAKAARVPQPAKG